MAVLFMVFSTGIPILASSCPGMAKGANSNSHPCPMCSPQASSSGGPAISRALGSCCRTTVAAERNVNEFLQVKQIISSGVSPAPALIADAVRTDFSGGRLAVVLLPTPTHPPVDILSRTSALLI
jgi:hypothetical protein